MSSSAALAGPTITMTDKTVMALNPELSDTMTDSTRRRTTGRSDTALERSAALAAGQILVIFAGAMIALIAAVRGRRRRRVVLGRQPADAARRRRGRPGRRRLAARDVPPRPTRPPGPRPPRTAITNGIGGVTSRPPRTRSTSAASRSRSRGRRHVLRPGRRHQLIPGTRGDAKAEYVLPVPMGSPENYYGVFGLTRGLTSSTTVMIPDQRRSTGSSNWTGRRRARPATVASDLERRRPVASPRPSQT